VQVVNRGLHFFLGRKRINFEALVSFFSESRLSTYLSLCNGNKIVASKLYKWNIESSGDIFESISIVESALRNVIDRQLRIYNKSQNGTEFWLLYPCRLIRQTGIMGRVKKSQDNMDSDTKQPIEHLSHDNILSQLTFGTWLLFMPSSNKIRQELWEIAIGEAFDITCEEDRAKLVDSVQEIKRIRNRIAHIEPVLKSKEIRNLYNEIRFICESIDPKLGQWYISVQKITTTLKNRPKW
jgi:hypothetical protein